MQIQPSSFAFTLLLGFLAAVPYSGLDINLPSLAATGATLRASPSEVGLTMSAFMVSLALAPIVYGPVPDRFGRKRSSRLVSRCLWSRTSPARSLSRGDGDRADRRRRADDDWRLAVHLRNPGRAPCCCWRCYLDLPRARGSILPIAWRRR
jgi:hypothetical protein